ncbi:MAG: toxic anion resistance protein [Lachnospiraceae bacterium]|nr:toxic anion resistance protein [Lachnospiraceae bacterium]
MDKFDEAVLAATPTLTFDTVPETKEELVVVEEVKAESAYDESTLSAEEKKMVEEFVEKIDLKNSNAIMQYGAGAQKKIADFSENALDSVRSKDLGEVGSLLSSVVVELKGFDAEEEKGFLGLFKKAGHKTEALKAKYAKAETNINKMSDALESHQVQLMKDTTMLDKMYDMNKNYFKELTMYILAGKKKLAEMNEVTLPQIRAKAEASGLPEDAQEVNDTLAMIDRFEKKIHDLELTRNISLQMAPQIRLIQNNDVLMSEKIQSTLVNTIPLWKSQMVIALGMSHSLDAAKAQREVADMTNELLKKNAAALKQSTIETAKEAERGIVDIQTLTETNQSLISTLDEVMKIQEEGKAKRAQAEVELNRIENEMKERLLSMRK